MATKPQTAAPAAATQQPASALPAVRERADLPMIAPERIPFHPLVEQRFGIDRASWRALTDSIFPAAKSAEGVILALSYCKARHLDPFKRPVHIVPIYDSQKKQMVESVWPGIGELRTTAHRTKQFAGMDDAQWGPTLTEKVGSAQITFPEWCQITVYKLMGGQRYPVVGPKVYWLETYATARRDDETPNSMWRKRTRGQLEKCAEAAALRRAFPEEIGNDYIAEEAPREVAYVETAAPPMPAPPQIPYDQQAASELDIRHNLDAVGAAPAEALQVAQLIVGEHVTALEQLTREQLRAVCAEIDRNFREQEARHDAAANAGADDFKL